MPSSEDRSSSVAGNVLESAARAGLDPQAFSAGASGAETKQALRDATDAAYDLGVFGVPTVAIGDELFWGDDRLEDAAAHLENMCARSELHLKDSPSRSCRRRSPAGRRRPSSQSRSAKRAASGFIAAG